FAVAVEVFAFQPAAWLFQAERGIGVLIGIADRIGQALAAADQQCQQARREQAPGTCQGCRTGSSVQQGGHGNAAVISEKDGDSRNPEQPGSTRQSVAAVSKHVFPGAQGGEQLDLVKRCASGTLLQLLAYFRLQATQE